MSIAAVACHVGSHAQQIPPGGWYAFPSGVVTSPTGTMQASVGDVGMFLRAPQTPTLTAPANGATDQPQTVLLEWNDLYGALQYHVEVATDAGFTSLVGTTATVADQELSVSGLARSTTYHWRVRASHTGGYSAWTAHSFTTASNPVLPPPALDAPEQNANCVTLSVAFVWSTVPTATSYEIVIATDGQFANVITSQTVADTTVSIAGPPLQPQTTYHWRVRASNATLTSAWSTSHSFTTAATAQPPVLASPANGAVGVSLSPTLSWNGPIGGDVQYEVQLGVTDPPTGVTGPGQYVFGVPGTNVVVTPNLEPATTYYWRVRMTTCGTTSAWTQGVFTTSDGTLRCLTCRTVDVGDVLIGTKRRRELRCINTDPDQRLMKLGLPQSSMSVLRLYYPDRREFEPNGYALRPGDSVVFVVDVIPTQAGPFTADLVVPIIDPVLCPSGTATVTGAGVTSADRKSVVEIKRTDDGGLVRPGDAVPFSVRLRSPLAEFDPSEFDTLTIRLLYDARPFHVKDRSFVANVRAGGGELQDPTLSSGTDPIQYERLVIERPAVDADGVLATFEMIAKLADIDSTRLLVTEVRWGKQNGAAPIQAQTVADEEFILRVDVCKEGGDVRLVTRQGQTIVRPPFPNPTNGRVTLQLDADANDVADIVCRDVLGRTLFERHDIDLVPGSNKIDVQFDPTGSGLLLLTVTTSSGRHTLPLLHGEIVR